MTRLHTVRGEYSSRMESIPGPLPQAGDTIYYACIDHEVRGAMCNGVYSAYDTDGAGSGSYLVTCGAKQTRSLDDVQAELSYGALGMQTPGFVDELQTAAGTIHVLIERTPVGLPLTTLERPLSAKTTARLLVQIATYIAHAHKQGVVLYGVRPELVWADGFAQTPKALERSIRAKGMTPRTMRFLLGMSPMRGGLCLADPYSPREVWAQKDCGPAVDVFGLCALGYFLLTNRAPFPADGDFNAAVARVSRGEQPDWSGVKMADVLAPGLAADSSKRPALAELAAALEKLA
jgi:hypothetical protein